jgi:hypothetical protein
VRIILAIQTSPAWVGMSYDGLVVSGWGSLARTQEQANQILQDLIDEKPAS